MGAFKYRRQSGFSSQNASSQSFASRQCHTDAQLASPEREKISCNRKLDTVSNGIVSLEENIYPWKSLTNYLERLSTYHPFALENIEECNGDSLDGASEPYVPEENIITQVTSNGGVVNFNLLS